MMMAGEPRVPKPSPLAGEGAERQSREAGEGACPTLSPHLASRLRSTPSSPARGEDTEPAARSVRTKKTTRARVLRANITDAERKLWFALRDRRFAASKFCRQVPVGPYVADFLSYEARMIIEVDGRQHAESSRDARRDRWFAENSFRVLHFWNDVLSSLDGVLTLVAEALRAPPQAGQAEKDIAR